MEAFVPKIINIDFRKRIQCLAEDFLAEKINGVDITVFNVEVLVKNNIDYKEYVSPGKSRLKRFLSLFPEFLALDEIKNNNGGTLFFCRYLDVNLLQVLEEILHKNNGQILLSSIAPILKTDYGIDYKDYSKGKGLLAWLKSDFSGVLDFDGDFCNLKVNKHNLIIKILTELIQGNGGKYLLANIGPKLATDYGIDYKELSNGMPLQTWLKNDFYANFLIDGFNLVLSDSTNINVSSTNEEVEQMHSIAFMSWWVNNAKILNKYTCKSMTSEAWSAEIARAFARSLVGLYPIYFYEVDKCSKIVFNTNIKTINGNDIYCVLKTNPANTLGNLQPYALENFCCILEEDSELCNEIKENIPDIIRYDSVLDEKYEELHNDLDYLIQLQTKASQIIPEISKNISSGKQIAKENISTIKSYYDRWNHAREIIEYLGWLDDGAESLSSIALLEERLRYSNRKADVLGKAKEAFVDFAQRIANYCNDNLFSPVKNIIDKDIIFANNINVEQVAQFKELICYYEKLMDISEFNSLTDELADILVVVNEHFESKISLKICSLLFCGKTAEDFGISSKKTPSEILSVLSSIDNMVNTEDNSDEVCEDNTNTTIDNITRCFALNCYTEIFSLFSKLKKYKLEEAIINGDYDTCRSMIENGEFSEICRDSAENLLERISELEENDTLFTFYECGMRLYKLIGNYHRIAEKYFLLGLLSDSDRCSEKLFDLYINENDTENFYIIWQKFSQKQVMSIQNTKFLLSIICSKNEQTIWNYLENNICVFYDLKYLNCLIDVLSEFNFVELENRCKDMLKYITSISSVNTFEQQVLEINNNKDHKKIIDYVSSFYPYMESIGYTSDEIKLAIDFLESTMDDEEQYTSITRLYNIQKNKNGTVEYLLWESLKRGFEAKEHPLLLNILNDSHRFEELCNVFKCYKNSFIKIRESRELYLVALLNICSSEFYNFACDNIQDLFQMIRESLLPIEMFKKASETFSQNGDERSSFLCNRIIDFSETLDIDVINDVVLLSENLRETAVNNEKLMNLGLQIEQLETFASVYKTGVFTRERDILSIAERLYAFVGTINHAALSFAILALECGYDSTALLYKIYTDNKDDISKLQLFICHPQSRNGREDEFCSLLIEQEEYERFLLEVDGVAEKTAQVIAQIIIAKCRLGMGIEQELTELHNNIKAISAYYLVKMLSSMCELGMIATVEEFLISHFDEILSYYAIDEIEKIVKVDGKLTPEHLKSMQKAAAAQNKKKIAFYIFEYFSVGRFKGASKEFFDEVLNSPVTSDEEFKMVQCHLRKIYAKNKDFSVKIVLREITHILNSIDDKQLICKNIEKLIEGVEFSNVGIISLMNLIKTYALPISKQICFSIVKMCESNEMQKECLSFFYDVSFSKKNPEFSDVAILLCNQYIDAINKGYFSNEWFEKAIEYCIELNKEKKCYESILCAYYLQKNAGNSVFAKYNLFLLLENEYLVPNEILSELKTDAENLNITESSTLIDLFVEMAEKASLKEIRDYCVYCGEFVEDKVSLKRYYNEIIEDKTDFTAIETASIVLKTLYCEPENGEYWANATTRISLEDHPHVAVKLLYQASLLNNKENLWKKCIDMCERYSQDEILADTLIEYARNIQVPFGLQHFRADLAEKVNKNSLYFSQINEEKLLCLISVLCERTEKTLLTQNNHSAIRDLSIIALATNIEKAYDIMLTCVEKYIFGENSNLGVAIVCRLIKTKHFNKAKSILIRLASIASIKYKNLIQKLAEMTIEDLSVWSVDEANSQIIELILPDGNYPDILSINELTLNYSTEKKAEIGAKVICEIINNKPDDYGCYMALYILCKHLPHRIDLLHMALCGLVRYEPVGNSKSYYIRKRKDFAMLLSNINALIISQQKNNEISKFDNYDFSVSASEYYQNFEDNIDDLSVLNRIQEAYDNIHNALMNQSEESSKIIYYLVFGYTTGNWSEFFERCWRNNVDTSYYLDYYSDFSNGVVRSLLKLAYSLNEKEQQEYIEWLRNNNNVACKKQIITALDLFNGDYYHQIPSSVFEKDILALPYEENSIIEAVLNNTVLPIISKAPNAVYPCVKLVSYLSCSNNLMSQLWKIAMEQFEENKNDIASKIFAVMNELTRAEKVYHGHIKNPYQPAEMYESMMRVAGTFAGDEEILKKIGKANFHPWSCINMIFALVYSSRANEANTLKQVFAKNNQQLVDTLLFIINKNVSDEDKIEIVQSISDETTKGLICYILKTPGSSWGKYAFLNGGKSVDIIGRILEKAASVASGVFGSSPKFAPRHFLWVEPSKINDNVYEQLDMLFVTTEEEFVEQSIIDVANSEQKLTFVDVLEPIFASVEEIEVLWNEHQGIHSFGIENYEKRQLLSQQMYKIALGCEVQKDKLTDYALRYGIDCYYIHMYNKDYAVANSIIKEMVNVYDHNSMEGSRALKEVVSNTALHELLHRGYSSIRQMAEDYTRNKHIFFKMRNMLPASTMSAEVSDVNKIFSALETIANCLKETTSENTDAYRTALQKAGKQLGVADLQGWSSVRLSVLQMIREEINRVNQRPIMDVKILNTSATNIFGYIFGQVKNIGNDIAENISIQFAYSNKTESAVYVLPKLEKGAVAAFEINYSVPEGVSHIEYDIIVSYENQGEKYNDVAKSSLTIKEEDFEEYPTGLYLIDRPIMDFVLKEDGTIGSENFFGREEEKKKINSVFARKGFSNYKNVIIKGIRRAGKTSILNYLLKYANLKCDDTVAVYIDCSGEKKGCPIQYTLIDMVILECEAANVGGLSKTQWDEFKQKWSLPVGNEYRNAGDLQFFYRELKEMNGGKGLMLILDEFDVLIEEVQSNQSVDSTLLPSLRAILNSPYCQDAVHIVICGSTKLIRYMDGGTFNQLFQQFGDNIIEIGRLLEKEMEKMLTTPYNEYPSVDITSSALDWIWKYTSGLVWYSKLVANCALKRAHSQKRSAVYPSDIVDAVTTVTSQDDYFKSLVTSCRPNELKVLDAIQSATTKATEYITITKLITILSDSFSQKDIEEIVNTLERMQVLQRNPLDRYSYRFAVELYWHYFRVYPSNRNRCEEIPLIFKEERKKINTLFDGDYFDV